MIDQETRGRILALIHKEVVPAIGCTEPMAVALCTARAVEQLGCKPEKIEALLSANILKNAMGVGIPGTGMTGLPIAIALGALIGKLSALCGCVVASTGSSVGIVYLMGGDYDRCCAAVKNMVANLTGMICDGAKPSCSLKLTSGVSTAILSALLAMEGKCVTSQEGIVDDDIDRSIHNLTAIGADAMCITDEMVLNIMTSKGC